ncbi:response regulator [Noviherbaspirillum humi]|uniref:response regulator n=1 Tax=Noviherbaspirillum humi TaxID=1688639 RepID=UPI001FEB228C|nr:response regulator [Noviherbaspirillum humi]
MGNESNMHCVLGQQQTKVLLIDDQVIVAEMISDMLHGQPDFSLDYVPDAKQALDNALLFKPTVVLVDLKMPAIDGFGLIRLFRNHPETRQLPIILLSSEESPENKVQGFSVGANDYLVKWPNKLELVARLRYHSSAHIAHRERDDAYLSLHRSQQELLARTRELAQSHAALHHAQKMEAVGKLTGGVAHDFNNVLQIISGHLQLLMLDAADSPVMRDRITAALDGVGRGAKLASQLLAFARRHPLQPAVIHPGDLLHGMTELLKRALGDGPELDIRVADDQWNTLVDPNQLESVILNLVLNARDAMGSRGRLLIATDNLRVETAQPGLDSGEYVRITVSDTGMGMPPDVLDRAFEPFFTTKPDGQGTGLGLSMAYGFVKQSGGHIDIDSRFGHGTTLRIVLPRTRQLLPVGAADVEPAIAGGTETVLVIEDEEQVRRTTCELLGRYGYRILQAEDGAAALRLLTDGTEVDLVFSDVVMPGKLRGVELAREIRKLAPAARILFASGYAEGTLVHDGKLEPGFCLLSKPYSGLTLARQIRHMLDA